MQIRIYDTDYEGHPVECTGERFRGKTALEIVESMKMDPFNIHRTPREYMLMLLDRIGQKDFSLPEDDGMAAEMFLQRLTVSGYGEFELDAGELTDAPAIIPTEEKK